MKKAQLVVTYLMKIRPCHVTDAQLACMRAKTVLNVFWAPNSIISVYHIKNGFTIKMNRIAPLQVTWEWSAGVRVSMCKW